jgi:hypothetical protein
MMIMMIMIKMKDDYDYGHLPLYYACEENAPFDIIKLFIDIYPEGLKDYLFLLKSYHYLHYQPYQVRRV